MEETFGAAFYYAHRVDLHNELKHLATSEDGPGKPAEILLKKDAVEYVSHRYPSMELTLLTNDLKDAEEGVVKLADGTTMKGDLIIGADGIHSNAAKYVIGHDNPAKDTGISCFRLLIPTQVLIDDPETKFLMEGHEGKFRSFNVDDKGKRLVWYCCRE